MNPVLLVSSITPSGRAWAIESALSTLPGARVIDALDYAANARDLVGALGSVRDAAMLACCLADATASSESTIVHVPGSIAGAVSDLRTWAMLEELGAAAGGPREMESALREFGLREAALALEAGDVEWLLCCPPEESALHDAAVEIAVGLACGLRVRGVAVCPMPRKSDGWPKSLRASARERVERMEHIVHPVPVRAAQRGLAPSFVDAEGHREDPVVSQLSDGAWVWSVTLPGMSAAQLDVGTWTSDPAYPGTHVVMRLDRWTIHRPLSATLRRCVAVDAVASADSLAVTFIADTRHWPRSSEDPAERGEHE